MMEPVFEHPRLGIVRVVEHPTSRKISARWKDDYLRVVVPRNVHMKDVMRALDSMADRIMERKIPDRQAVPEKINLPDWDVTILRQSVKPRHILVGASLPHCTLSVGDKIDLDSENGKLTVDRALHALAKIVAPQLILPHARELAEKLGCRPVGWKISHGRQVLGHCDRRGMIAFSHINVYLTSELRHYIICHELAHLTHMNHSAQFHALCNSYLQGREKELMAKLRNYKWPIKR